MNSLCEVKRRMTHSKFLLIYPLILYVAAFTLWLIDNNFCEQLRAIRSHLPFPLSGLFQFHAWWHVFTALASQSQAAFNLHLRSSFLKQDFDLKGGPVPFIRVQQHGHQNGDTFSSRSKNGKKTY
ncbi:putative alkaline ceramidase 3 [Apostichopus japonicus]|uniref:Alkaline ceramidase n=1 Tax=Stichopus japonicus TaxID=307972 RepID=A0A2G8LB46_STIJA|nr:putative alkaline ceramidase 3 [Apostichopus japonicus]